MTDGIKKLSELSEGDRARVCVAGWDHPYSCDCRICEGAWALMGPDGFIKGSWGPFTEESMKIFCEEEGVPFIEGQTLEEQQREAEEERT